jgi:hypothetical protein
VRVNHVYQGSRQNEPPEVRPEHRFQLTGSRFEVLSFEHPRKLREH